jgi:hypothetical protein
MSASRWDSVATWLVRQLAYLLTAFGAFAVGLSLGLWLGSGSAPVRIVAAPARPASEVAAVSSERFPTPVAQTDDAALGDGGSDEDSSDLSARPAGISVPAGTVGSTQPTPSPDPNVPIGVLTIQAEGFTAATLRGSPSTNAPSLATLSNGTRVEQLPGTADADDYTWVRVRAPNGTVGWVVAVATQ